MAKDEIDAFEDRMKKLKAELPKLEARVGPLEMQTDKLTELFGTAVRLIGEAAEKDKAAGVTGTKLKQFLSARHVKEQFKQVIVLEKSAEKTYALKEKLIADAGKFEAECEQVQKDTAAFLKAHKKDISATEYKRYGTAFKQIDAYVQRLIDKVTTRVVQKANAGVKSPDDWIESFTSDADEAIARAKADKDAEAQAEIDALRFDKRHATKALAGIEAHKKAFMAAAKVVNAQTVLITSKLGAKKAALDALQDCVAAVDAIHKVNDAYLKHLSELDDKHLARLMNMPDFKKTKKLLDEAKKAGQGFTKTISKLQDMIEDPPPPKNPVPPAVAAKLAAANR